MERGNWQKCFSNTHQTYYWFNSVNGESVWEDPEEVKVAEAEELPLRKRRREDDPETEVAASLEPKSHVSLASEGESFQVRPKIAVIVPFRDLHEKQHRYAHLRRFIPYMTTYLSQAKVPFRIYVIEQSKDGRKFNRGKLLNIGFVIAQRDSCESFVFHDVDLLPSPELLTYYVTIPHGKNPIHIASVWHRYTANPRYFGGVNAFSISQFESMNGFPNNFWGWGGEDDELFKRSKAVQLTALKPTSGTLEDLEDMTIQQKMAHLKENSTWKCMNRTEVLEEHDSTWRTNGLSDLRYTEVGRVNLDAHAVRITVDLETNNHWTDLVSGVDDTQLEEPVEIIKQRFAASQSISPSAK